MGREEGKGWEEEEARQGERKSSGKAVSLWVKDSRHCFRPIEVQGVQGVL